MNSETAQKRFQIYPHPKTFNYFYEFFSCKRLKNSIMITGVREAKGLPFLAGEGNEDLIGWNARRQIFWRLSPEGACRPTSHQTNHS